ncbi:hypothetical protein [Algoriphagus machipongonensis]|uniref:Uncharacterized protein n=1 Tax=Algoriphagus machipongonensis TaxID=388413 RepID=A3HVJ0_9BACT|nr:hypothetical protein [Algoriphagus machipongonensis]EAZ82162.1 hypothetical protein ALPR1_02935 [Algoriphagus machipongonensis]
MEIKGQSVIRTILFSVFILCSKALLAQELPNPRIINEENFIKSMRVNTPRIFAMSPLGNIDSVKYEGYYAVLKINNRKVSEIVYPTDIEPLISRMSDFAKKDINERIGLGEFKFLNIDQIIVPAIVEYIHFETEDLRLDVVLEKILPKIGFTPNTYVLSPVFMQVGNPKR